MNVDAEPRAGRADPDGAGHDRPDADPARQGRRHGRGLRQRRARAACSAPAAARTSCRAPRPCCAAVFFVCTLALAYFGDSCARPSSGSVLERAGASRPRRRRARRPARRRSRRGAAPAGAPLPRRPPRRAARRRLRAPRRSRRSDAQTARSIGCAAVSGAFRSRLRGCPESQSVDEQSSCLSGQQYDRRRGEIGRHAILRG